MFPTPAKTPQKHDVSKSANVSSIARNLFATARVNMVEEAMPSPRKHKKYSGFSLGNVGEDEQAPIPIFTDSKERIPEVDKSTENPFYTSEDQHVIQPAKKDIKRRKVAAQETNGSDELTGGVNHKEGMFYVFRGKKVFRRFSEMEEPASDDIDMNLESEMDATVPARLRGGPITRSSVKPRLLFPSAAQLAAKQNKISQEDEEADTDIEDVTETSNPFYEEKKMDVTPRASKFTPLSPPTTAARVTRSKNVSDDDLTSSFSSNGSHAKEFQSWQKTRTQGQKRERDAITSSDEEHRKRLRG